MCHSSSSVYIAGFRSSVCAVLTENPQLAAILTISSVLTAETMTTLERVMICVRELHAAFVSRASSWGLIGFTWNRDLGVGIRWDEMCWIHCSVDLSTVVYPIVLPLRESCSPRNSGDVHFVGMRSICLYTCRGCNARVDVLVTVWCTYALVCTVVRLFIYMTVSLRIIISH
jgi:hypothetical protein